MTRATKAFMNPFTFFIVLLTSILCMFQNLLLGVMIMLTYYLLCNISILLGFYLKQSAALRSLKKVCREKGYSYSFKRKGKFVLLKITTPQKNCVIEMFSVFRFWKMKFYIREDDVLELRVCSQRKPLYIAPKGYVYDPQKRIVENFMANEKSKGTVDLKKYFGAEWVAADNKILMICPSDQNVYYLANNQYDLIHNGCRMGQTRIYTLKGLIDYLNDGV